MPVYAGLYTLPCCPVVVQESKEDGGGTVVGGGGELERAAKKQKGMQKSKVEKLEKAIQGAGLQYLPATACYFPRLPLPC